MFGLTCGLGVAQLGAARVQEVPPAGELAAVQDVADVERRLAVVVVGREGGEEGGVTGRGSRQPLSVLLKSRLQ